MKCPGPIKYTIIYTTGRVDLVEIDLLAVHTEGFTEVTHKIIEGLYKGEIQAIIKVDEVQDNA